MKNKIFISLLIIIGLFIFAQIIIWLRYSPILISPESLTDTSQISSQKLFDKAWKEINTEFYDSSLNSQNWIYWKKRYKGKIKTDEDAKVAIDTMLTSLDDDYSRYMDKQEYATQNASIESKISGIGVNIMNKSGKIFIYSVLKNTPAQFSGLKANDIILKVDGKNVTGMNIVDVSMMVRGKEDSFVNLVILRNDKIIEKKVKRAIIKIESVKASVKNDIGYIEISSFIGNSTSKDFIDALNNTKNSKGLIIDLRGNTGGLLANAIFITNMFIDNGKIVSIISREDKNEDINARANALLVKKPLVILLDGASASASEILAGALKDHKRAILVGTTTFGKGLVQRIIPLPNSTGLNITIAKYLTPNGNDIHKKGITPDYIVNRTEADFYRNKDPQIEKAETVLMSMINK